MRCNFREETKCPDGGFLITTCLREAEIGELCYKCAYEKAQAELTLHRWIPVSEGPFPKDGKEFLTSNRRQGGILMLIYWDTLHKCWRNKDKVVLSLQATHWCAITLPKGEK